MSIKHRKLGQIFTLIFSQTVSAVVGMQSRPDNLTWFALSLIFRTCNFPCRSMDNIAVAVMPLNSLDVEPDDSAERRQRASSLSIDGMMNGKSISSAGRAVSNFNSFAKLEYRLSSSNKPCLYTQCDEHRIRIQRRLQESPNHQCVAEYRVPHTYQSHSLHKSLSALFLQKPLQTYFQPERSFVVSRRRLASVVVFKSAGCSSCHTVRGHKRYLTYVRYLDNVCLGYGM